MSRPRLRTERVPVYLSPVEASIIRHAAARDGESVAAYLRSAALDRAAAAMSERMMAQNVAEPKQTR